MQITIKGRHWKASTDYRQYAVERLEKLQRYFSHLITAELTVTQEGYRYQAELKILGNGVRLQGRAQDPDPRVALDAVLAKQERALKRRKDQLQDRKKRRVPGLREETALSVRAGAVSSGGVPIVRIRPRARLLSVEAAARALLRGQSPVLLFTEEGAGLRLAYRMGDGQVGLIELD